MKVPSWLLSGALALGRMRIKQLALEKSSWSCESARDVTKRGIMNWPKWPNNAFLFYPFLRLLCNFDIDDPWQRFAQLQFSCSALWVTLPEVLLCLSTKELSPIEHVGNSFIPALFLHGVEDDPCQQIYDMLQLNEVRRSLEATWEMQGARDREAEKQHIICWGFYTSTPLAKTLWGRLSLQLFDELFRNSWADLI